MPIAKVIPLLEDEYEEDNDWDMVEYLHEIDPNQKFSQYPLKKCIFGLENISENMIDMLQISDNLRDHIDICREQDTYYEFCKFVVYYMNDGGKKLNEITPEYILKRGNNLKTAFKNFLKGIKKLYTSDILGTDEYLSHGDIGDIGENIMYCEKKNRFYLIDFGYSEIKKEGITEDISDVLKTFNNYIFDSLANKDEYFKIGNILREKIEVLNSFNQNDISNIEILNNEINILKENENSDMINHLKKQKPKYKIISIINSIIEKF